MKTRFKDKPRIFEVRGVKIKDFGKIYLNDNEMVSFVTKDRRECDFTAKDWGFYLGPSLNSRLKKEGFRAALVLNEEGSLYINAVEKDKINLFRKYLKTNQKSKVIYWLDRGLCKRMHK